jgi:hypothetical protein
VIVNQTKYFFDTEFMENGEVIELLSIGIVAEDGREYYAESADADWSHANPWVVQNVLPHMTGDRKSRATIAREILSFTKASPNPFPEFWAWFGSYDWIALVQLYGTMVDLPFTWPAFVMDLKQLCVTLGNPTLPVQTGTKHNALEDARWTRDAHLWLIEHTPEERA